MIREAELFDVPRINELGELLHENFKNVYKVNEMLKEDISKVIVYECDDKVVGFISATNLYDTCDIIDLVVDPIYRKRMIATNLINYLIGDLNENVKLITLEVAVNNKIAIDLYEKFGFEIIHKREKYYNNSDAYLMARKCK